MLRISEGKCIRHETPPQPPAMRMGRDGSNSRGNERRHRIGMRGFEAITSLIDDYKWAIEIEICVFPQEGLTNYPGTEELLVEGLKRGAKVLGGGSFKVGNCRATDLFACTWSSVGMEACATAHQWARELKKLAHDTRLMPPISVKAYVKRGKNDAADAAAICETVVRPSMRFCANQRTSSSRVR